MFILFPAIGKGTSFDHVTNEQYLARCKEFVGDDSIPLESKSPSQAPDLHLPIQRSKTENIRTNNIPVINVSKWYINEIIAEYYSDGNM
jgi:hypothetical protein